MRIGQHQKSAPVRRRHLAIPVLLVACVLVTSIGIRFLLTSMDRAVEENGTASMQAVVEQLQQSYNLQVDNYYNRLRILESYAAQGGGDLLQNESLGRLVHTLQDNTGWQILFIKDNGTAATIEGTERRLDVSSALLSDLQSGQDVAKLITYNDGKKTEGKFLLAIPCDPYELGGQTFSAMGALVDRSEMDAVLKMYAYSGEAFLFMLGGDGEVLYTNQTDEKLFQNYSLLKHLEQDGAMTSEQASALRSDFKSGELGVGLYGDERAYYLGHAPIQDGSSTIVCIVARRVVDSSLSTYQKTVMYSTLFMAGAVFLLLAALFYNLWKTSAANQRAAFERTNLEQQERNLRRLEAVNAELEQAQGVTAEALQSARAASEAKTSFLASMSHDIRTPMNAIIGLASLIEHDAGNEARVREYVRRIQVSSQALLSILNEVLDMNRIESGKTTLDSADFSIVELAHDAEDMFRPQAEAKGQTFVLSTGGIRHEWLRGDAVRLMQIVSNLLSNAVKYTQAGGTVGLAVEERPASSASFAKLRIVVEDNGMGMDEDFQGKIFDAFTREESTLTNKIQGTGLGMAITKNLVDLMGGTISVSSKKGQGSRFEVLLSLRVAERGAEPVREQGQAAGSGETSLAGMRFLCAEDNELNAEILTELLQMEGASCTVCENGQDLLETFERSRPGEFDMILMDVQMPVMNGYEATRAVRGCGHERAASVPIVAMTANAFSEDIQASLSAGMNAHISKPINMDVLKRTVASL